jgi:hypothetical protein
MTAITNSFDTFLEKIRLTPELRDACRDAHNNLRARLLADPELNPIFISMFLQGSYARHTGTKPFGEDTHVDVDLVVVTNLDWKVWTPDLVVARFTPFLDREYPNTTANPKHWEHNDRSIKISPAGTPVTLDLVVTAAPSEIQSEVLASFRETGIPEFRFETSGDPGSQPIQIREAAERLSKAFLSSEWQQEPLKIPSRDLKQWLETHPLEQLRWTQDKNDQTNGLYINVVKAIRWWRKQNPQGEYPKSYPLEHFIGDMCPDAIRSVAEGATRVFERIRDTQHPSLFGRGVPVLHDRGVPMNDVFRKITPEQYRLFYDLASAAAAQARAALDAQTIPESASRWRDLFGPEFPAPPSTPFFPPTGPAKATVSGRYG